MSVWVNIFFQEKTILNVIDFNKPLFIEKPVFDSVINNDEIVRLIKEKNIKTYVSGGMLYITFDAKGWSWASWKNNKLKAYITVKNLEKLTVSGACNVSFVDPISSDRLLISVSGASDIKGPVKVNSLKVGASGASNISLSGTATETDFNISGACSIKSLDLVTNNCAVVASGASSVKLTINQSLKANISGASDIRYKGTVNMFNSKTSGASSIKPL